MSHTGTCRRIFCKILFDGFRASQPPIFFQTCLPNNPFAGIALGFAGSLMTYNFQSPQPAKGGQSKTKFPVLVWVQCKGYRCLAYQNERGKWINFYTNQKITDFVSVVA
jgi:hypothetical protein